MKFDSLNCLVLLLILLSVYYAGGAQSSSFKWNPSKWIADQEVIEDNLGTQGVNSRKELSKCQDDVKVLKQSISGIQGHVDTLLQIKESWKVCTQTAKEKDAEISRQMSRYLSKTNYLLNANKTIETLRTRLEKSEAQLLSLKKENKELIEKLRKKTENPQAKFQKLYAVVDKFREDNVLEKDDKDTMLYACIRNNSDVVEALLDLGVDIHSRTESTKSTCLHYAALRNYTGLAKLLLKRGCNVDVRDIHLRTPLIEAVSHELLEIAQLFIDHNADINTRIANGSQSAYSYVKNSGKSISAEFLKSNGALEYQDPSFTVTKFIAELNLTNDNQTIMEKACSKSRTDVIEALLDIGVDIHIRTKDPNYAFSCLHIAAHNNDVNLAKLLLKRGCNVDVKNTYLSTPLMEAAYHEKLEISQFLIDNKADIQRGFAFAKNARKTNSIEFLKKRGAVDK